MRILFVASEAVPFIKTGGLADVAGALPKVLFEMGHDVRLVIPRYGDMEPRWRLLPLMPEMKVQYGPDIVTGSVLRCDYPGSRMPVYFIDEPAFSLRKGIYGTGKADYSDNDRRFAGFCMAALWLLKGLDWQPDVIHANDWQTGLLPVLLKHHPEVATDPFYQSIRSVFAIHNMAYQGNVDKFVVPAIGLPWDVFNQDGMEFYGRASYLKGGIAYADAIVTVSPTYAKEIQTEEFGAGMHGTLAQRSASIHGILNGIDTGEWNPAADPALPAAFSASDLSGKATCKRALQEECGLPVRSDVPLLAVASRLVEQKGFGLILGALEEMLHLGIQLVVLGTGAEEYEEGFRSAMKDFPKQVHTRLAYDVPFSHRLIAGADAFLMPSLFEPCGLTQMYSMRYGTLPIVRRTGGLADSVVGSGQPDATGFSFSGSTAVALYECVRQVVDSYGNKANWQTMMQTAMRHDWNWSKSAAEYAALYESLA